ERRMATNGEQVRGAAGNLGKGARERPRPRLLARRKVGPRERPAEFLDAGRLQLRRRGETAYRLREWVRSSPGHGDQGLKRPNRQLREDHRERGPDAGSSGLSPKGRCTGNPGRLPPDRGAFPLSGDRRPYGT